MSDEGSWGKWIVIGLIAIAAIIAVLVLLGVIDLSGLGGAPAPSGVTYVPAQGGGLGAWAIIIPIIIAGAGIPLGIWGIRRWRRTPPRAVPPTPPAVPPEEAGVTEGEGRPLNVTLTIAKGTIHPVEFIKGKLRFDFQYQVKNQSDEDIRGVVLRLRPVDFPAGFKFAKEEKTPQGAVYSGIDINTKGIRGILAAKTHTKKWEQAIIELVGEKAAVYNYTPVVLDAYVKYEDKDGRVRTTTPPQRIVFKPPEGGIAPGEVKDVVFVIGKDKTEFYNAAEPGNALGSIKYVIQNKTGKELTNCWLWTLPGENEKIAIENQVHKITSAKKTGTSIGITKEIMPTKESIKILEKDAAARRGLVPVQIIARLHFEIDGQAGYFTAPFNINVEWRSARKPAKKKELKARAGEVAFDIVDPRYEGEPNPVITFMREPEEKKSWAAILFYFIQNKTDQKIKDFKFDITGTGKKEEAAYRNLIVPKDFKISSIGAGETKTGEIMLKLPKIPVPKPGEKEFVARIMLKIWGTYEGATEKVEGPEIKAEIYVPSIEPSSSSDDLYRAGVYYQDEGKYGAAIPCFVAAARSYEDKGDKTSADRARKKILECRGKGGVPPVQPIQPPQQAGRQYPESCLFCGNKNTYDRSFCAYCGSVIKPLKQEPPTPQPPVPPKKQQQMAKNQQEYFNRANALNSEAARLMDEGKYAEALKPHSEARELYIKAGDFASAEGTAQNILEIQDYLQEVAAAAAPQPEQPSPPPSPTPPEVAKPKPGKRNTLEPLVSFISPTSTVLPGPGKESFGTLHYTIKNNTQRNITKVWIEIVPSGIDPDLVGFKKQWYDVKAGWIQKIKPGAVEKGTIEIVPFKGQTPKLAGGTKVPALMSVIFEDEGQGRKSQSVGVNLQWKVVPPPTPQLQKKPAQQPQQPAQPPKPSAAAGRPRPQWTLPANTPKDAVLPFERGLILLSKEEWIKAAKGFQDSADEYSTGAAWCGLAVAHAKKGEPESAITCFREAKRLFDREKNPAAVSFVSFHLNELMPAKTAARPVQPQAAEPAKQPEVSEPAPKCVRCKELLEWVPEYKRWYCFDCEKYGGENLPPPSAQPRQPTLPTLTERGLDDLAKFLAKTPISGKGQPPVPTKKSVEELRKEGAALAGKGEYEEAIKHYDRILADNPYEPATLSAKGTVLIRLNKLDEAELCFMEVRTYHPNFHPKTIDLRLRKIKELREETPKTEVEASEEEPKMIECVLCGKKMRADTNKCPDCGTVFEGDKVTVFEGDKVSAPLNLPGGMHIVLVGKESKCLACGKAVETDNWVVECACGKMYHIKCAEAKGASCRNCGRTFRAAEI